MKSKRWFLLLLPAILFITVVCTVGGSPATSPASSVPKNSPIPTVPAPGTGAISGRLSYPAEGIPAMRVVAFDVVHPGIYYYVDTALGAGQYLIENLPPGVYHVVSYRLDTDNLSGGYTQMVPCGLSVSCTDHSFIDVLVRTGQTTENVDPGDWYAPTGTFPAKPGP